jgi:hypothetical protein
MAASLVAVMLPESAVVVSEFESLPQAVMAVAALLCGPLAPAQPAAAKLSPPEVQAIAEEGARVWVVTSTGEPGRATDLDGRAAKSRDEKARHNGGEEASLRWQTRGNGKGHGQWQCNNTHGDTRRQIFQKSLAVIAGKVV